MRACLPVVTHLQRASWPWPSPALTGTSIQLTPHVCVLAQAEYTKICIILLMVAMFAIVMPQAPLFAWMILGAWAAPTPTPRAAPYHSPCTCTCTPPCPCTPHPKERALSSPTLLQSPPRRLRRRVRSIAARTATAQHWTTLHETLFFPQASSSSSCRARERGHAVSFALSRVLVLISLSCLPSLLPSLAGLRQYFNFLALTQFTRRPIPVKCHSRRDVTGGFRKWCTIVLARTAQPTTWHCIRAPSRARAGELRGLAGAVTPCHVVAGLCCRTISPRLWRASCSAPARGTPSCPPPAAPIIIT